MHIDGKKSLELQVKNVQVIDTYQRCAFNEKKKSKSEITKKINVFIVLKDQYTSDSD